jgi:hypothetical protein
MMPGKEQNKNDHTNHNFFFSQIVANDNDFIGFVAYTIYKKNKIEYIEQFKKDNSRPPTDEELLKWQYEECTNSKKKNYRSLTENKVNKFINELRGDKEKDLKKEKEKNDELKKELDKRERNIKNRDKYCNVKSKCQFGSGILQSFIATLIYVVLGFIFIKCGGVDLLSELINTTSK